MHDYAVSAVGIEGIVAKGRADPYRPGQRGWVKVKIRETADALVGAVVGSLAQPRRLVLGRIDDAGALHVAGSTHQLQPRQQAEVGALLKPPTEPHPWPATLSLAWGSDRVEIVHVTPTVQVEVVADAAMDGGRWRHLTRYVRLRVEE
jgi:ATP-dependent DNA ligase